MLQEITLDATELEPPEPFDRARGILHDMLAGEFLRMLHRRVPYPLFDFCAGLSLKHHVIQRSATSYEILVYFPDDEQALREDGLL
jgi:hypothetical protein